MKKFFIFIICTFFVSCSNDYNATLCKLESIIRQDTLKVCLHSSSNNYVTCCYLADRTPCLILAPRSIGRLDRHYYVVIGDKDISSFAIACQQSINKCLEWTELAIKENIASDFTKDIDIQFPEIYYVKASLNNRPSWSKTTFRPIFHYDFDFLSKLHEYHELFFDLELHNDLDYSFEFENGIDISGVEIDEFSKLLNLQYIRKVLNETIIQENQKNTFINNLN